MIMARSPSATNRFARTLGFIACLLVAWLAGLMLHHVRSGESTQTKYLPQTRLSSAHEVVMVLITASTCAASQDPGLAADIEKAKLTLRQHTSAKRVQFRAQGVALDWDVAAGYDFLRRFGQFDQVSVGANWLNDGGIKYIWRDFPGDPVMPQIVLVSRDVTADANGVSVGAETVVERLVGIDAIRDWVRAGAAVHLTLPQAALGTPAS